VVATGNYWLHSALKSAARRAWKISTICTLHSVGILFDRRGIPSP